MILSIMFFIGGVIIGVFVYAQMLLPLFYGLPVSISMAIKGKLKPVAILYQLLTPLIWFVGLFIFGFILAIIWPNLARFFAYNQSFQLGTTVGFFLLIGNVLTRKGRADVREEFNEVTVKRFAK